MTEPSQLNQVKVLGDLDEPGQADWSVITISPVHPEGHGVIQGDHGVDLLSQGLGVGEGVVDVFQQLSQGPAWFTISWTAVLPSSCVDTTPV